MKRKILNLIILTLSVLVGLSAFAQSQAQTALSCEDRCDQVTHDCLTPCRDEAAAAEQRCEDAGGSTAACQASYDNTYISCASRDLSGCQRARGCSVCYACPDWRMGTLGIPYYCSCGNPIPSCFEETPDLTGGESPVLIDVLGNGFALTNASNGVGFDLNGDGSPELIAWTAAGSDDAWLAFDRNGNGSIDNGKELFGNFTQQVNGSSRNGFLALAEFDKAINEGNGDGRIDYRDTVFGKLRLWQDLNHNGVSEPVELASPRDLGITEFELTYRVSKYIDSNGNEFRYRAKVRSGSDSRVARWAWDVFLVK